jgi:alanyl-tRNA synthetase
MAALTAKLASTQGDDMLSQAQDIKDLVKVGELVNYIAGQAGDKSGGKADMAMAMAGGTMPAELPAALASAGLVDRQTLTGDAATAVMQLLYGRHVDVARRSQ